MNSEIKCPKCGEIFKVDESGYADLVKQVRDKEFNRELQNRAEALKREKESALELAKVTSEKTYAQTLSQKEQEVVRLRAQLDGSKKDMELAVARAMEKIKDDINAKDRTIIELRGQVEAEQQRAQLEEKSIREVYEGKLKDKEEQIGYYKDLKARMSTKMVGETLEQHCEVEFNRLRATGFQKSYFEKDNDARGGSKGDYIFKDYSEEGIEIVSIMFEMKNEMDTTATKKRNEDFFKELDKDRKEKRCEYAVLVSLLEADNELYNTGIVDVSYKYPKMYVIRPQFFIPMITLLRNAALKSLEYKTELETVRNQNIDISNFENNLNEFKDKFGKNYRLASEKFQNAIKEIDKSMAALQKVKDSLISSENNLRLANAKAEDVSIKKLTRNSPTMEARFEAAEQEKE